MRVAINNSRKQKQRHKIAILAAGIVLLALPTLFCIVFAFKMRDMSRQIESMREEMTSWIAARQEENSLTNTELLMLEESLGTGSEDVRRVYLTFDDGPSQYTGEILEILDFYNVKATFFVTGCQVPEYDEYYSRILEEGHALGIHSYSHVYNEIYTSLKAFRKDWKKMQDYIYECTGETVTICRFPGGSSNTVSKTDMEDLIGWLNEEGAVYYDWNVSAGDAESGSLSPEQIAYNCIEGVKEWKTAIVLLHDTANKENTIEALPLIIEGIQQLEDTILLPINEETVPIQHVSLTKE